MGCLSSKEDTFQDGFGLQKNTPSAQDFPQTPTRTYNIVLCGEKGLAEQLFQRLRNQADSTTLIDKGLSPDCSKILSYGNLELIVSLFNISNGYYLPVPSDSSLGGIIFMLDATVKETINVAKENLAEVCKFLSDTFPDLMLLVFAQGTEEQGALDFHQVKHMLELRKLPVDGHFIQSCSIDSGAGIQEGMGRLVHGMLNVEHQLIEDAQMQSLMAYTMFMNFFPMI
eukprot:jgi/Galph1/3197/GphlegSOOS_G1832.1